MFAKAAAHASTVAIKVPIPIDSFDIKVIQYKYALFKLQELQRLLGILEKNLKTNEHSKIIPLVNYILVLCDGYMFNISATLRKRYKLLCEYKLCKTDNLNPPISTQSINLQVSLPDVFGVENHEKMHSLVYNNEFQWDLLNCLKRISQNAIIIYNRRMRQLQLQKTSTINRPYEISEFKNKQLNNVNFNISYVEDLLRPVELSLSLDLAVLINDKEKDTSEKSFFKLQYQVMDKFGTYIDKKVSPLLKTYYYQLQKYSNLIQKGAVIINQNNVKEALPNWQFSLHRIYAMLLRIYSVLCVMKGMLRQVYLPNKPFFTNPRTKLVTKNVCEYEELLHDLDELCEEGDKQEIKDVMLVLDQLSSQGMTYQRAKTSDTVTDLYQEHITKIVRHLRLHLHVIKKWLYWWKDITDNSHLIPDFNELDFSQIEKMLNEKKSVDRLAQLERKRKQEGGKISRSHSSDSPGSTSSKSSSATISPLLGALNLNNDDIKPIDIKKKIPNSKRAYTAIISNGAISPLISSRSSSFDKNTRVFNPGLSPISKVSSPRNTNDVPFPTSDSSSPNISRKPSISVGRSSQSNNSTNGVSTSVVNNTNIVKGPRKIVRGRPRSTSLQSSFTGNKAPPKPTVASGLNNNIRANSLEATAALNRRLVQDAVKRSMVRDTTGISSSNGSRSPSFYKGVRSRSNSGSNVLPNSTHPDRFLLTPVKPASNGGIVSPITRKKSTLSQVVDNDEYQKEVHESDNGKPEALIFSENESRDQSNDTINSEESFIKKVRFTGVPPMTADENPKPKRKGWYKKPATLHYSPAPPQIKLLRHKLTQEGVVFRTSLRENYKDNTVESFESDLEYSSPVKRTSTFFNADEGSIKPYKESVGHKFALKIRDKLRS